MKKILILVEGQTEMAFVKRVLSNHFDGICQLIPTINTTKLVKNGPDFKGGITNYNRIKKHIINLLGDSSADMVTTMLDYYGLPNDFPKYDEQTGNCFQKVEFLEQAFGQDINNPKFLPYFQLHEFEALLFSAPRNIDNIMVGNLPQSNLELVRNSFSSPEEINNNPSTCPSRRIIKEYPGYEKVLHGQIISENISVETILSQCAHFSTWIQKIKTACAPQ